MFVQNFFPFHNWIDVYLPVCIWFISCVPSFNSTFLGWVWSPDQYTPALRLSSAHLDHITSNQGQHKSLLLRLLLSSLWLILSGYGVLSTLELYSMWFLLCGFLTLFLELFGIGFCSAASSALLFLSFQFPATLCHVQPPASVPVLFSLPQPISPFSFISFFFFCYCNKHFPWSTKCLASRLTLFDWLFCLILMGSKACFSKLWKNSAFVVF